MEGEIYPFIRMFQYKSFRAEKGVGSRFPEEENDMGLRQKNAGLKTLHSMEAPGRSSLIRYRPEAARGVSGGPRAGPAAVASEPFWPPCALFQKGVRPDRHQNA